jgi:hypothetical protein
MKQLFHTVRAGLLGLACLMTHDASAQGNTDIGQVGTFSQRLTRSPEYPTDYDLYDTLVQPLFSPTGPRDIGYPDGSQLHAEARGETGFHASPPPHRVSARISSYGSAQYIAGALTHSVTEWQPRPNASATLPLRVEAHLSGSLSLGGGNQLFSAVGDVYAQFEINATIYRLEEGNYVPEQDMDFYTSGKLRVDMTPLVLDGDLTIDDWEESSDGETFRFSTDVGVKKDFLSNGNSTYWVVVYFGVLANVDKQGDITNSKPITVSAEFGNTLTVGLVSLDPTAGEIVPVAPRQLRLTTNGGSPSAPRLLITGQPGGMCVLETSTDLQDWVDAATNAQFSGNWTVNDLSFDAGASRFFRVRQVWGDGGVNLASRLQN